VVRAIDRGQWQAPLGSSRGQPPDRRQLAAVLASVKDKPSAALKAPSLTAAARDGDGNMRSGGRMLAARVEQKNGMQRTTKIA
jgi:hypothetical protein